LAAKHDLTDHEGTFLSLVLRIQPATAYQVTKIYEDSPVSNFNTSKGKIYPLIRRLAERGLLAKTPIAGDGRGAEELSCTAEGKKAVREWARQVRPTHLLLDDPLRTKVQSFGLLSLQAGGRRPVQGFPARQCGELDPGADGLARPDAVRHHARAGGVAAPPDPPLSFQGTI
jgi:DNA-binding PadR family transcriptional regulator